MLNLTIFNEFSRLLVKKLSTIVWFERWMSLLKNKSVLARQAYKMLSRGLGEHYRREAILSSAKSLLLKSCNTYLSLLYLILSPPQTIYDYIMAMGKDHGINK